MIVRELKHIRFAYDLEDRHLLLQKEELQMRISRTEMFSLARFILRIAQKGKPRKVVRKNDTET